MGLIPGQDTVIPHATGRLSPHATLKSLHSPQKRERERERERERAVVQGHGGHLCLLIGFTEAKENFLTS